jgi:predicted enzyme related to lactoylglutathione lyase
MSKPATNIPERDRTIDYIEFGATDLEATKRFYAACFGWKFTDYGPDYAAFEDGRLTGGFTTDSKPGGAPLVVLYATNLEQLLAAVKAQRGRIVREIFSFPGGRRFHFLDPNGNELAIWSGTPRNRAEVGGS